jgi:hypothetical protein
MTVEHDKAQQFRGEALRTRVMVANALCAIAESEVKGGMANKAMGSLQAIRHIIEEIGVLISEPNQISTGAARELSEFLSELELRTRLIEAVIRPDN